VGIAERGFKVMGTTVKVTDTLTSYWNLST